MGQISVKTYAANGSLLNDNQHMGATLRLAITLRSAGKIIPPTTHTKDATMIAA
jgi:hypothetical protein